MAADTSLGTRIRKRRQVLRMTQERLAAMLGVSKSTVANWERGKHFPLRYMGALEDVLGTSLEDDNPPEPRISAELRRMIGGLSPDERAWVLAELSQAEHRSR